jgi:hypothetical protein
VVRAGNRPLFLRKAPLLSAKAGYNWGVTNRTMNPLTPENCHESPTFRSWWDGVHDALNNDYCWDEGVMLSILVDLFNEGIPIPAAATQALESYEIGQAEAWMGVPSWA